MPRRKGTGKEARFLSWYRNNQSNLGQLEPWQAEEIRRLARKAFMVGYAFAVARNDIPTNKEMEKDEGLLIRIKEKLRKKYG